MCFFVERGFNKVQAKRIQSFDADAWHLTVYSRYKREWQRTYSTVSGREKDEKQSEVVVTTERRQMEMECDGLDNKRTKGRTSCLISFLRQNLPPDNFWVANTGLSIRYIHFGMGATERVKRIDSYLKSERKTMMRESNSGKERGTIWSLIETESARIKETEKGRLKGNVGNPPLSRIPNNLDTNSVS